MSSTSTVAEREERCAAILSTDRWGLRLYPPLLRCSARKLEGSAYCGHHEKHAEWYDAMRVALGDWEIRQYRHMLELHGDEGLQKVWQELEEEIKAKGPRKAPSMLGRINSIRKWWVEMRERDLAGRLETATAEPVASAPVLEPVLTPVQPPRRQRKPDPPLPGRTRLPTLGELLLKQQQQLTQPTQPGSPEKPPPEERARWRRTRAEQEGKPKSAREMLVGDWATRGRK